MSTDAAPSTALPPSSYAGLFQAVGGMRNGKAVVAMLGCMVVGIVLAGLLVASGRALGFLAPLLAMLVWFVAAGTGVNAAGVLHMDVARGGSSRSLVDALVFGLVCLPKLIVLALVALVVEIVVFLAIAILLFICKIPFLGPVLFTVVFPLSIVVAGLTLVGLFIGMVLSVPALWQGASITRALAQTFAILKSRLIEALLLLLVVGFLAFAVGLVVFGVLGVGLLPVLGMSGSIVGFAGLPMGGLGGGGFSGGHAIAGGIGGAVLWAVAASVVAQVYLLGLCLVYLRVTAGLDLTATESALREKLDEARRRTAELSEKAKAAARTDPSAAPAAGSAVPPFAPPAPFAPPPPASPAAFAAPPPFVSPDPFAPSAASPPAYAAPPAYAPASPYAAPPPYVAPPAHVAPPPYVAPPPPVAPLPAYPSAPLAAAATGAAFGSEADSPTLFPPPRAAPAPFVADIDLPIDTPAAAPAAWPPRPGSAPANPAAAAAPGAAPAALASCPQCLSAVTADDVFCGVCGYRLK